MRRIITFLVAISTLFIGGLPAIASADLTVSAPTSIEYDPAVSGFTVSGITISNAPAYLQVGLTIVDTSGTQVPATDKYRVAVGDQCTRDASWTNPGTGAAVTVSGDNSTNVILSGAGDDITAILGSVWIYQDSSDFCNRASASNFGQSLLNRKLQVSAIESQPGLMWSPSTHHYYQLATQTTDDGMGQPTDDNGNITDSSRYFVKWSTARAEAKSASITIGGQTHRGYLASIITRDEFSFLNDNVTGGSGILYPAWVGGSDAGTEGIWNWVDGPEALKFGGDSITRTITTTVNNYTDPMGTAVTVDENGWPHLNGSWLSGSVQFMRDASGTIVQNAHGYKLIVDYNTKYCQNYADYYSTGIMVTQATPYGSTVICDPEGFYLQDGNGTIYHQDQFGDGYTSGYFFDTASDGQTILDGNGDAAVLAFPDDFTLTSSSTTSTNVPNYEGARFWGMDSGSDPGSGIPDYCTGRGVRGICLMDQTRADGVTETNSYYVYWSNGNGGYHSANWDGTGVKPGDGVYNPQPDNYAGNNADGEDALIVNWCARNPGAGTWSAATEETLYGNPGYFCTPGWNDLTAGDWGLASTTYSGPSWDTPNQIGTTDYVVEYCGYSDESACETTPSAVVSTSFTLASSSCPGSGTPQLSVSYSAPGVDSTDLTSSTMATETFDNVPAGNGWLPDQMTNVGYLSGYTAAYPAGVLSGSGGVGNFISASDSYLTLPTTECYVGFWWSAGNAANFVDLLDDSNNVLATFNASDLVNALGGCPNPYCGNPNIHDGYNNGNELYAYVHMRLPTGFQKVHFYGAGFELDTISTSVTVPGRANNETSLTGPVTMGLTAPDVIPVDPLAANVTLPELQVSGDSSASLCLIQVADSEGTSLDSTSLTYVVPESDPVTLQPVGPYLVLSGSTSDVITASGHLVVGKNDSSPVASTQSTYLRVFAVSGQTPDATTCSGGTSNIIEIRPIGIDLTQVFDIPITDHSN